MLKTLLKQLKEYLKENKEYLTQFKSPFQSVRAFFVLIDNKPSLIEESYLVYSINPYLSKHY